MKHFKDSYTLPGALHKDDANKLKEKLFVAFQNIGASVGDVVLLKWNHQLQNLLKGAKLLILNKMVL